MKLPTIAGGLLLAALSLMAAPVGMIAQDAPEAPKPAEGGDKPAPAPAPARPAARPPAPKFDIKGKVMLPDGKPAAGAIVAQQFDLSSGSPKVARGEPITVNDDGSFSANITVPVDFPLVAYSADGKHAAWVMTNRDGAGKGVDLKLAPVTEVSGSLHFPAKDGEADKPSPVDSYSVVLGTPVTNAATGRTSTVPVIAMTIKGTEGFKAGVPAGTYNMTANPARDAKLPEGMWVYDLKPNSSKVEVKAGEAVKLGNMRLELSKLASYKGKTFPEWKVSEAKNTNGKNQIADYKGKWILVEFWGHW